MDDKTSLLSISPYLTNEFLSSSLTKWFNSNTKFTKWEHVGGTRKGDSYLSELIRIKIYGISSDNIEKHVQVVLKCAYKSMGKRLTFRADEFFKNEIMFYNNVLPVMLEFQNEKNLKEPFHNYTKLFMSHMDGANDFLGLEDACQFNFEPVKVRQEGIDYEHCKTCLKTFAHFHAISFALRDQKPEKFKEISRMISETYYCDRVWPWYERFWAVCCNIAIDAVEKELPNSKYYEKIKEFASPNTYFKCAKAVLDTFETGVISHSDSWTNNFLFKYDNDTAIDSKMIDFQLTRCGSPVLDVSFFIYACTTQDLREQYYEKMLDYYYTVLAQRISELGSDPDKVFSRHTFMKEVKDYSFFGLAFSLESIPVIVLEPDEVMDIEVKGDEKVNIADIWKLQKFKTKKARMREVNNIKHAVDMEFI